MLGCPVGELSERMTSAEFTQWTAYWNLEPFGAMRDNWHAAQIAALLYNINRGKSPAVKTSDFMYEDPQATANRRAMTFSAFLKARVKKDG